MKNLVKVDGIPSGYLTKIINSKYNPGKSRLLVIEPRVTARYTLYKTNFDADTLENVIAERYSAEEKEDLENCYHNSTESLGELIKEIKDKQPRDLQGTCQYCGMLKPNSIDHYLPQSSYPEFSVHSLNLLPCCIDCNGKKNNYWVEDGVRGIINFYIDKLPQDQFLFVNVVFDNEDDVPFTKFYINIPNTVSSRLATIIGNHFKRLDLCVRFEENAHDFITSKIESIESYLNSSNPDEIYIRIKNEAAKLTAKFGENNWRAVLTNSLAESTPFINMLVRKISNTANQGQLA